MMKKILLGIVAVGLAVAFYGEYSLSKLVKKIEKEYMHFEANKLFSIELDPGDYMLMSFNSLTPIKSMSEDPVVLQNDSSSYPIDSSYLFLDSISLKHDSVYLSAEMAVIKKLVTHLAVQKKSATEYEVLEEVGVKQSTALDMKTTILNKEYEDLHIVSLSEKKTIAINSTVFTDKIHGLAIVRIDESRQATVRQKYLLLIAGGAVAFIAGIILIILVMRRLKTRR